MVGVGGAAHYTRGGASVRRDHLPRAPAHPATVEEASSVETYQGIVLKHSFL